MKSFKHKFVDEDGILHYGDIVLYEDEYVVLKDTNGELWQLPIDKFARGEYNAD